MTHDHPMGYDPWGRKAFKATRNLSESKLKTGNGGLVKHKELLDSFNKNKALSQTFDKEKPEGLSLLSEENILDE